MTGAVLLQVDSLRKRFGGIHAVNQLTFDVREREVTSLVGPNGAGKTTVFNLISGVISADSGKVVFKRRDITTLSAQQVNRAGIARTFQQVRLFWNMSVMENLLLAFPEQVGETVMSALFCRSLLRRNEAQCRERAEALLADFGLLHKRFHLAREISYGQQKRLELARVLATGADLLLLDEPMAGLDPRAVAHMQDLLRSLPERGKTVLLIDHQMETVRQIAAKIVFLSNGRAVSTGTPDEVLADPRLHEIYFSGVARHEHDGAAAA